MEQDIIIAIKLLGGAYVGAAIGYVLSKVLTGYLDFLLDEDF
jgi:hypothetical protein